MNLAPLTGVRVMAGCGYRDTMANGGQRMLQRLARAQMHGHIARGHQRQAAEHGGQLKLIAVIKEPDVIEKILKHIGLDPQQPPRAKARRWEDLLAGA